MSQNFNSKSLKYGWKMLTTVSQLSWALLNFMCLDLTWSAVICDNVFWLDLSWLDHTWHVLTLFGLHWPKYVSLPGLTCLDNPLTWHTLTWPVTSWPVLTWPVLTWPVLTWPILTWHLDFTCPDFKCLNLIYPDFTCPNLTLSQFVLSKLDLS